MEFKILRPHKLDILESTKKMNRKLLPENPRCQTKPQNCWSKFKMVVV